MNKDLDHYMSLNYSYKLTPDPDVGYFIEIPELRGCMGSGASEPEAFEDINDSKKIWLETALEKGYEIPLPEKEIKYSGQFLLRMPKSLHQAVAEEAEYEGVSINQYINTLITENRHIRSTKRQMDEWNMQITECLDKEFKGFVENWKHYSLEMSTEQRPLKSVA